MIAPQRAAVRPRVLSGESDTPLLLEEEVRTLLDRQEPGVIVVLGPPGSGKTTALRHLAAVLPNDPRVRFLDEANLKRLLDRPLDALLICTPSQTMPGITRPESFQLLGWGRDDLIEYLLAVHPRQCASVMKRFSPEDEDLFQGIPELCRPVLDRLAADPSLPGAREAFHAHLRELLADTDLIERARSACLNAVCAGSDQLSALAGLARPGFAEELTRTLRHPPARQMLAAERIVADLHAEADCDFLARRLSRELVRAAAELIRDDSVALDHLWRLLTGPSWSHAMSASLLHAADVGWIPTGEHPPVLAHAYLVGAVWPGVQLHGADLRKTDFSGADLSGANLCEAVAFGASFHGVKCTKTILDGFRAVDADLSGANFVEVTAQRAQLVSANLEGARLEEADLRGVSFAEANLKRAHFLQANLAKASFLGARIEQALFCDIDLSDAVLSRLCLREALWQDARLFARAQLDHCDLEELRLPGADFEGANLEGALLTATVMPRANFRHACLRDTGLADIDWEDADLRDADLQGATFHLGSSRSGLVGSPIACEGSRTGFYTDDYEEQCFKAPEEIRKANLCGADLRGAVIDGVDFYLVDLRGARLDPAQEEHVRRCKAILETPVY